MMHRVGRITLAVALIVMGVALVIDNTLDTRLIWYAARLWPLLLVLLGVEWLLISSRLEGERGRVPVDSGAVVLLVIIALLATSVGRWWWSPFRNISMHWGGAAIQQVHMPQIQLPPIVIPPIHLPSVEVPPIRIPSITLSTNQVSHELLLTHEDPVEALESLLVESVAGSITVESGERFAIELQVIGYGRDAAEAERNAQRINLMVDSAGTTTRVSASGEGSVSPLGLNYRIVVPAAVNLDLRSVSGSITVAESAGSVRLQSISGALKASNVGGDLTTSTVSGATRVERVGGAVRVNSTSGGISVIQPAQAVSSQSSSGSIGVTASQVGGDYDLTSVSGSIQVTLPGGAPVAVKANSTSGSIAGPSWVSVSSNRRSASGSNGSPDYQVTLRTTSGSIRIEAE